MKNYIVNDKENLLELNNAIGHNTMADENGQYYINEYYLCFINSHLVAVYRNNKQYTHMVILEKSRVQEDYLIKSNEFKFQKTFFSTPKEIIDKAINKDLFLNKAEIVTIQV